MKCLVERCEGVVTIPSVSGVCPKCGTGYFLTFSPQGILLETFAVTVRGTLVKTEYRP